MKNSAEREAEKQKEEQNVHTKKQSAGNSRPKAVLLKISEIHSIVPQTVKNSQEKKGTGGTVQRKKDVVS